MGLIKYIMSGDGRKSLKKLKVYAGSEHEHEAQKPEMWTGKI